MTVLKVEEMHCNKCVERITNALRSAEIKFSVDLKSKTVTIDGSEMDLKRTIEILDDLGFEATVKH